jgi:hypothetical protein
MTTGILKGERMSKLNLELFSRRLASAVTRCGPEILTGLGIAGMVTAAVMAVRATPKALILIEEKKAASDIAPDKLKPIEAVKAAWACYLPAAVTGGLSIVCLIGANKVNARRNAAIVTAYTISESVLKEYQAKVIESIGEKKEQAIRDLIAKDKLDRDPIGNREVIIAEKGNTLCYDALSGRYFKSDIEKIKKAVNEANKNLLDDMFVSLNDLYYEIGLKNTRQGDDLGWNVADGLIDLQFSSHLADDGTPCLVLDYRAAPRYDYKKR